MTPLIEARGLEKRFPLRAGIFGRRSGEVRALDRVDLEVGEERCVALVGESGSGKTTLGRCLLRLIEPDAGSVLLRGEDLLRLGPAELRRRRRDCQMIFQDPYTSLNPRLRIGDAVAEPLRVHGLASRREALERARELLERVGLPASAAERYPHEFSGGQRQRVGIARALASGPSFVVADEPVSALDVSVRAQILNLLAELQQRFRLGMLFISHDLAVVEHVADEVVVMYLGRVVEQGGRDEILARPLHPYTVRLLSATPGAARVPAAGSTNGRRGAADEVPDPARRPPGCAFHPRCPIARERCRAEVPALREAEPGRWVACHFPGELGAPAV
ncbi:MAG: ABC transporter ATP-binding protein [Acidobacteriota bacterium]